MNRITPNDSVVVRPAHYRDLDVIESMYGDERAGASPLSYVIDPDGHLKQQYWQSRYRFLGLLGLFLNPLQYLFCAHSGQSDSVVQGAIRVSPFNRSRTTWRVDRVAVFDLDQLSTDTKKVAASVPTDARTFVTLPYLSDVGSQLLRYCFETIWEARTWLLEVDVNDKELLALYRLNGFQPLAHMTYWEITPEALQNLVEREPDLPNLLPVGNADAQLLYQLDTASMPPLVRQVFDRHVADFKTSLLGAIAEGVKNWLTRTEVVDGYVFEPQRKAAIGYFRMRLCRDGSQSHQAQLTVHPAYTWLYPELLAQMAHVLRDLPAQALQLVSSDYQPEREAFLEQIGATQIAHTLMMSRSVWHKVKEAKTNALEALQIAEMLQGLKPARKPVPSRIVLESKLEKPNQVSKPPVKSGESESPKQKPVLKLPTDLSNLPPQGS
ncbi:MAG TPA: GNAT family N-acetyltransferase [Leptolyngbyaceae cyanobacterium M33_DOE_097]|uniref:GNAT family N-acetyltransferase n=1 Tax=Oscillatoriales cyanobacterium SpSt-418 TaxID=2282169 RepID=A0A7C3PMJ3_9CYAN|nr:GNAT family N-acetyltransferase [Leptolyngbyaceae cyanobacterium M33_DOE_097]